MRLSRSESSEEARVGRRTFSDSPSCETPGADPTTLTALKAWRLERARQDEVPAFVVFHDTTLEEIACRRPRELWELAKVSGVGPTKLERYGTEVILALAGSRADGSS